MHYLMGRYGVSQRRATRTARFCRSSLRYESRRDPLTALRQRMRELAESFRDARRSMANFSTEEAPAASTPSPPEYSGMETCKPNSAEK